jgi:hypothetical protein
VGQEPEPIILVRELQLVIALCACDKQDASTEPPPCIGPGSTVVSRHDDIHAGIFSSLEFLLPRAGRVFGILGVNVNYSTVIVINARLGVDDAIAHPLNPRLMHGFEVGFL